MALTGKFLADFQSFYAAVQKADVELRGMETGAGKVGSALNRMVDGFSGRKLAQDASLVTEAVERIGGASKLTEAEQRKVNATVTEAIAKYKALGIEAPAALQKIAADTKQIPPQLVNTNTGLNTMISGLKSAAGLLGIAFSARALVGFVGGVFDAASKVKDLSTQLGISTNAVQGFKFAAEQSGSSLDAVGTAIQKMNQKLGEGDKSTIKALADVGLKFEDIRQMKPEDAFLAITDQIQKIEDPMLRAKVALELFGKGAAELLPAIDAGIRKTADGTTKMSEQTIKDLDAAQDAWEALFNKVTIVSGGIIAATMRAASQATRSWEDFFAVAGKIGARMAGLPGAGALADAGLDINELTAKQRAFDAAFDAKFRAQQAGGGAGGGGKPPTPGSLGTVAVDQHAKAVKALMDAFSGANVIATANLHLEAITGNMRQGIPLAQMTRTQQDAINKAMADAQEVYRTLGQEVPPAIRAVYIATLDMSKGVPLVAGLSTEFAKLGAIIKVLPTWVPSVSGLTAEFGRVGDTVQRQVIPPTHEWQQQLSELSQSLSQLSQISGDTFGGIVRDLATLVSATDTATKGFASFKAGKKEGFNLSGILEMSTGILGIASAAIQAGKALKNMFFGSAGRDLVKDFAGSMGGFDALREKLVPLGAEGERLWIALTQGVGKNNPTQAQAAIDAITSAWAKEEQKARDVGVAVIDAGEAHVTATTKAQDAIRAMDDELKSLFKSIENEAPEEVMGIIEANTRAQIAGIQKERDAAQLALEQTAGDAAKTAEEAAKLIEQTLGAHDFRVKVKIDLDDPSGILSGKLAGGILRGGTPATAGSSGGGDITVMSPAIYLDGEVLLQSEAIAKKRLGIR